MRKNRIITINEKLEILLKEEKEKCELPEATRYLLHEFSCGDFDYTYVSFDYVKNKKRYNLNWYSLDKIKSMLNNEFDYSAIKYFWNNIEKFERNVLVINSIKFVKALIKGNIEEIKRIPKSDLHNHTPYGGSRKIIKEMYGKKVPMLEKRFKSIPEMNHWCDINIKEPNDYIKRIRACFLQAKEDGIKVFAPNFATCAQKNFKSFEEYIDFIKDLVMEFSETMQIFPELALDRNKHYDDLEGLVTKFLDTGVFYSIDLTGNESLGVDRFEKAYSIASKYGIIKKAHVGEFSNDDTMFDAIIKLNLDVIQHGIAAEKNNKLMKYLKENNISLTICPSSNYYLSRINAIKDHPVKNLYHHNVNISICSDDILIFDSDVSKEYMRLFENHVLSAFELNTLRLCGLNFYAK